jgi:hypothetical protein
VSTLEIIVEDLKSLPANQLAEAAAYVHRLREIGQADRAAILRETSGILRPEDADAIEKAINGSCERIDAGDW